jgi:nitroreductase
MDSTIPAELLELKACFDRWRATRKYNSEPIPDELRSAALEMTERYSSSLLQRVLKVQLWHLKKRGAAKRPARAVAPKLSKAAFFKLPIEPILPTAASASPSNNGYRVQIERPDGARLTITVPPSDAASIERLCADFLRDHKS